MDLVEAEAMEAPDVVAPPAPPIIWAPQAGPQKALIDCGVPEIFFGGARGGGKTDGVLGKWALKAARYGKWFNAIMFRPTMPSQDDAWERACELFVAMGATVRERDKLIKLFGGRVRFRPLESVADADKYQGQNLTDVWVEEAGQYPDPRPIDRLWGALRSAHGVPTQMILTGNPGGPGQLWIKARYVDPRPGGMKIEKRPLPNGSTQSWVYIPSRIRDNKVLLAADPRYIDRLYQVGSAELVRAWLEGDWSAIEGAYFDCWSPALVIRPVTLPSHWLRFRAFDWGSARPFSVGWWAVASEALLTETGRIPAGALVCYREWYGASGPNQGLKLHAEEVAAGIVAREAGEEIRYSVADPSIFAEDGGPSIAERMYRSDGILWRPADNRRVAVNGHAGGWDQMRARMIGEDGRPMIYWFSTCADSIRTIPALQHDVARPEDVDSDQEDHAADQVRYACCSRPYALPAPQPTRPVPDTRAPTLDELVAWHDRRLKGQEKRI